MAGLIVLFWFVGGGVALRYFVRFKSSATVGQDTQVLLLPDTVYGRYVLYVRPLGRCRYEPTKIAALSADLTHPILQTIQ